MRIIIALVFSLLAMRPACAAVYYVDYVSGSDSNNGTATSSPWKHSPGDCSSGNCNIVLQPGDQVIFKGGVTYVGGITVNNSGNADTTEGKIIFDGDSGSYAARWGDGTGKAEIDCDSTYNGFTVGNRSYVTINNFEISNGRTDGTEYGTDKALISVGSGSYVTISNNYLHDVGLKVIETGDLNGHCIASDSVNNLDIYNNDFSNCYDKSILLFVTSGTQNNLKIRNNTITDITGWAIGIPYASSGTSTGWEIHDNTIHDLKWYSNVANGWAPENDRPHTNYIFIFNGGTGVISGLKIYNNNIYEDGTAYDVSGGIHFEKNAEESGGFLNTYIYNNSLVNIAYASAIYLSVAYGSYDGVYIYGNSIYQPDTCAMSVGAPCGGIALYTGDGWSNVNIANNIIATRDSSAQALVCYATNENGLLIDHNLYWVANTLTGWEYSGGAGTTWANFKTGTSQPESNSIGQSSDPGFVDPSAHNLRLSSSSSPAYDAGTDLSATIGGLDTLGISRPQGASWDIGAYEYVVPASRTGTATRSPTGTGGFGSMGSGTGRAAW